MQSKTFTKEGGICSKYKKREVDMPYILLLVLCNYCIEDKKHFIFGQVFCQSSLKLIQNEKDYSLALKLWLPNNSRTKLNLESCIFFEVKNLIFHHFSKIWKFNNPCNIIKSRLGQKGTKFVCYVPTVIKR